MKFAQAGWTGAAEDDTTGSVEMGVMDRAGVITEEIGIPADNELDLNGAVPEADPVG